MAKVNMSGDDPETIKVDDKVKVLVDENNILCAIMHLELACMPKVRYQNDNEAMLREAMEVMRSKIRLAVSQLENGCFNYWQNSGQEELKKLKGRYHES